MPRSERGERRLRIDDVAVYIRLECFRVLTGSPID